MRYLRDLPALRAQFSKIDPKKYPELIKNAEPDAEPDPLQGAAWAAFTREYVTDGPELTTLTALDVGLAMRRGPLPRWALSLLTPTDFKHIKEVMKEHDRKQ